MLNIQRELRTHDPRSAIRHLVDRLHLEVKEVGNLVSLNYDMIESPKGDPVADECRGLILEKLTWNVVAYPFKRFYNIQESQAAKMVLDECVLLEKLDGSLIMVYWYDGEWRIASRGVPDAGGSVGRDGDITFNQLVRNCINEKYPDFWKALNGKGEELGPCWDVFGEKPWQRLCLVFEVIGPKNRIVTPYKETDIVLLTARDMDTLEELQPGQVYTIAVELGVRTPEGFSFKSLDHIQNMLKMLPALNEGYVLTSHERDAEGNYPRVKIKNPAYLAAAQFVKGGVSDERMLECVITGSADELVGYFNEYAELRDKIRDRLLAFIADVEERYDEWKGLANVSRKEFALQAAKHRGGWLMFSLLDDKIKNVREGVAKAGAEKVLAAINKE